jgi:hypothetical protein
MITIDLNKAIETTSSVKHRHDQIMSIRQADHSSFARKEKDVLRSFLKNQFYVFSRRIRFVSHQIVQLCSFDV